MITWSPPKGWKLDEGNATVYPSISPESHNSQPVIYIAELTGERLVNIKYGNVNSLTVVAGAESSTDIVINIERDTQELQLKILDGYHCGSSDIMINGLGQECTAVEVTVNAESDTLLLGIEVRNVSVDLRASTISIKAVVTAPSKLASNTQTEIVASFDSVSTSARSNQSTVDS